MAAVLFLDLDRFKFINDTLGHTVGDELLKIVAKRLTRSIRPSDTAARLGGDEFILLLSDLASVDDVTKVIKRIHGSFDAPVNLKGHELTVTASIGVSVFPADGADAEELIKNADTAMYRAKAEGRNNAQFYTPAMNETGMEWIRLERKLRVAIEKEEFVLHYQPQIDLSTGKVIAVESLVRWQEPETGLIPPGGFIKMAEDTGLIVQIGEWVLRKSCMDCKRWHDMSLNRVHVSVNLSMRQFKREGFVATVAGVLEETGLPPEKLELELTESIIIEDADETVKKLQELKNMGVRLAIDDFGTGYSSLAYLKRMPLDVLKIDQSFVRDINVDEGDRAICAAVIRLAGSLGIKVVAEGVETTEQLGLLKELDCGYIQGYLVTKPVPYSDVQEYLDRDWCFSEGR
jgi:diguanylate cyclase (GGDEF)-like protein